MPRESLDRLDTSDAFLQVGECVSERVSESVVGGVLRCVQLWCPSVP